VPNNWNELDVKLECNAEYGAPLWTCRSATLNPCEDTAGGGTSANNSESSCSDWDPVGEITFNSATSVYEINEDFVDYIVEDPMRLANCDAGRIKFISSVNEFQVKNASSGTILYELGFRNDDVVYSVNRLPLDSHSDAGAAFGILYLEDDETEYSFKIIRGSSTIVLEAEIVP